MTFPPGIPHVVIVGGGFGGLNAVRSLRGERVRVTLIDRHNYHLFQPLLYQVATAVLSPGDIASPIRWILRRQTNVRVLLAETRGVIPSSRRVLLDSGEIGYDYLILATGATHAYFGHEEWAEHAPGLKTLDDALEIRRRVLLAFERAEREERPERQQTLLTFVVIGGGPTGVEMAGALAEIARQALAGEYRSIRPDRARILLVEAGPTLLPAFPEPLRRSAERALRKLGVEVRQRTAVSRIGSGWVEMGGERLEAATILWAAGVAASPLGATLNVPLDRVGRVLVESDLSVPGQPRIFAIGDLCAFVHQQDGRPLPGVAPVAIQQGRHVANMIRRDLANRLREPFLYKDPGSMATIGRAAAVADFGWLRLTGGVAWLAWLFVHIMQLIGFRNRALVSAQWAWSYITYQRSVRLITGADKVGAGPEIAPR
jgi:NADH:ubiquinone reductase (H+-translocating)